MISTPDSYDAHELAIVRTLQAMLEDAVEQSDFVVARELTLQIEHERRRLRARGSR